MVELGITMTVVSSTLRALGDLGQSFFYVGCFLGYGMGFAGKPQPFLYAGLATLQPKRLHPIE